MKILLVFLCSIQLSFSQTDLLKEKFLHNVKSIADNADAVVGVAIKDLKSGEQVLINENEVFPQASSIKIHILAEVYKQAAEGKFKLSDIKQFPSSARVGGSGILSMLGEKSVSMSIRDYCILMINLSDNSATNLLIDLVGMKNVNESLGKNGVHNTKLQRVMMDYQAAKEGRENISTPKDVLTILEKLYSGTLVNKQSCDDMIAIMKMGKGGSIKDGIPADVEIANKAGDVEGVRVDAGIVYLENNPYIICVMTKMLLNENDGAKIIAAISKETFNYIERKANSNQYGRRIPK
ncbi:MAG: serine hydrolase [Bacteroidota bacterium]